MKDQKGQPVAIASPTLQAVETQQRLSDLFAMHYRRVLMAAYRITGSMADAEDVAQSVFLRLTAGDELRSQQCGQLPVSCSHQRWARPVAAKKYCGKRTPGFGCGCGLSRSRIAA